jgi:hypothetical protein
MLTGPVSRVDDRLEFIEYGSVAGENHVGQEFRFKGGYACGRRSEFGIYSQSQGVPIPAGSAFEVFAFASLVGLRCAASDCPCSIRLRR